jgi:XTP/dITP diphosphohydrolase
LSPHSLIIASENRGKLTEFQSLLSGLPIKLVTPGEIGLHLNVAEEGHSYAENAALKALAFMSASGMAALADDTGLEVEALDGRPGLYSHRITPWPDSTDSDRRAYLLDLLKHKPRPWSAHFHCTLAIAVPGEQIAYASGDCPGEIIPQARGGFGFGYDPIFYLPEKLLTMAELDERAKNQISHRGRAIQAAIPLLRSIFGF